MCDGQGKWESSAAMVMMMPCHVQGTCRRHRVTASNEKRILRDKPWENPFMRGVKNTYAIGLSDTRGVINFLVLLCGL
ncbi:hypothetical protein RRG08_033959 [Elysia crispata]|uniref:Uncharacterized protein n=1 Tax=Elysia crispata TaxID=231223 RepID=A0AAE0YSF2_9GAST|nr:hypothetical protein RRG08_033959 [Elysia crispata]